MGKQSELFDRAAECERLMKLETDDVKRTSLRLLRELWIALANESANMSAAELTEEVAKIDEIQSDLIK